VTDPKGKIRLRTTADLDGRTTAAKRAREIKQALVKDLGADPSTAQDEMATRAAVLGSFILDCEVKWMSGEPVDTAAWHGAVDRQRRLFEVLGVERKPREVRSLADYVASKERK
jgi:hypothetical protein